MSRRLTRIAVALLTGAAVTLFAPVRPAAAAGFADQNDYCLGQCGDILPPGENGNATLVDILANQLLGTRPAHSADQLDRYANLLNSYTGLTDSQLASFYNDSSFGVPANQVERTETPRSDVTILRDHATGVPHITGTTRSGTMFGAGYAGAEDRLFLMDLLRHVGRGQLTSFAGGAPGNQALEQSVWRNSPYTDADLDAQVQALRTKGSRGAQLYTDVQDYIAGINAYIAHCMSGRNCPGEYVLTGHLNPITNSGGPQPFAPSDLIAISGVVGGLFGGGGGGEIASALVRIAARARYGTAAGDQAWRAFREQNDPETVLTLHDGQSFPYGQSPAASGDAPSVVMPDAGSVSPQPVVFDPTGSAGGASTAAGASGVLPGLRVGGATQQGMSNAAVVSAANSATGHPVAVFGPQTGYFSPQLLMLEELQGPGISARGAAFPGVNLYVQLGRGQDYAWSATSAEQDITDTYAVPLCEPSGAPATVASTSYLFRGVCTPMEALERDNSWRPNAADSTPMGSYKLIAYRTKYGLVEYRGMAGGQPVAFTLLRSTYRHEADSAIGFQMFDDPAEMGSAAGFQNAAANIGYAFNWFYVNSSQAAYFNSGSNPVRAAGADPNLPQSTGYEWQGWDPQNNTATYTPPSAHPQSVDQGYYVSWNNKQAADYSAADGNFSFGAVQRAQLLDAPLHAAVAAGQKLDRAGVARIVEDAANTDLRGKQVLGSLLQVIDSQPVTDPTLAATVNSLRTWYTSGSHRRETSPGSRTYQDADAIRVFDAWWPLLVAAEFQAGMGGTLYQTLAGAMQINESPSGGQRGGSGPSSTSQAQSHKGSSFQFGWWGYVSKDLRSVLGQPVTAPLPVTYCGGGDLAACRQALLGALSQAAAQPASQVYPADSVCSAGDQWCADAIEQSPLGGITDPLISWQNRPTYQQVVSFPAHRGQNIANLAAGATATASSTQLFTGNTPGKAADGDPATRWSSGFSDNQSITLDLGSVHPVQRVILAWEAAYGRAYHLDVSTDGRTWRQVYATGTGDGGVDSDTFPATTARYVRMVGTARGTSYGYSLYEFGVYGS
jgi:acyl-homoserine lactone acylase PvdQ